MIAAILGRGAGVGTLALALASCAVEPSGPPAPRIEAATAVANPNNVLSAIVTVRAHDADSVAVRFQLIGVPGATADRTAAVPLVDQTAVIPVLGLEPSRSYEFRVVAFGAGAAGGGQPRGLLTRAPPAHLPGFWAKRGKPPPRLPCLAGGA